MTRRASAAVAVLAVLVAAAPVTALEVAITRPEPGQPVFGPTTLAAEVYPVGAEVDKVEFYFDGLLVGVAAEAPYEVLIDASQRNAEHALEVVAHSGGETASARLRLPALRVDDSVTVRLKQLYVSLEGSAAGARPYDAEDFEILDAGQPQEIVTFATGDVPFSAVLLIDASASMQGDSLRTALAGARSFVRRVNDLDEAKMILFSDRVLHETPFTNFASLLTVGLSGASARGGSAINDALYLAHKRLERRQGRKVAILLSDGIDIDSVLSIDRVRRITQRQDTVLYWIRLGGAAGAGAMRLSSWRQARDHRRELEGLEEAVAESGGKILPIADVGAVDGALRRLLDELRSQYVIGYYPSVERGAGSWHEVAVRVRGRANGLRTRRGYLEF